MVRASIKLSPFAKARFHENEYNNALGPVLRKMIKFNLGLSQILGKVLLYTNMSLELTQYCCVFTPRFSEYNIERYSEQYIGS